MTTSTCYGPKLTYFVGVQMPDKSSFDKSKRILNHSELMVVDKYATQSNEIAK